MADIAQSQKILEIDFQNPQFTRTGNWAREIGGDGFPLADYEWTQVLAPSEEYDRDTLVGATGWVINPHHSHADFPFTHPFVDASSDPTTPYPPITDWEFFLALDYPKYHYLLSDGNRAAGQSDELEHDEVKRAYALKVEAPEGLLGVEIDGGLVPPGFKAGVEEGDRVAVFGRWIVDTGHKVELGGPMSYRAEIHPPLLMVSARVQPLAGGQPGTRVLFTSRPYLPGQRFTTDTDQIYNDAGEDDGPTLTHLLNEYAMVSKNLLKNQIEAHQKIKSYPFRGAHRLHIKVRPPAPEGEGPHIMGLGPPRLAVSFRFTVRSGCDVQVSSSSPDTVDILISLNELGYKPPKLPTRHSKNWTREEFEKLSKGVGEKILLGETAVVVFETLRNFGAPLLDSINVARILLALEQGVKADLYEPLKDVNINSTRHAVIRAWADAIPSAGILRNDVQPFPIFGWLEATWQRSLDISPERLVPITPG